MREIKLRAWDNFNKLWVGRQQGFQDGCIPPWIGRGSSQFDVMQYTGLKDKNGKEIYEGDIVKDYSCLARESINKVEWDRHGFWLISQDGTRYMPFEDKLEVIGNIYENPKLLEGVKHA